MPPGKRPLPGVTSELIADAVTAQAGPKTIRIRDLKEVVPYLLELIQPGDLVLTLGAGQCLDGRSGVDPGTGTGKTGDRSVETTEGERGIGVLLQWINSL